MNQLSNLIFFPCSLSFHHHSHNYSLINSVGFWLILTIAIGAAEQYRATVGWVPPEQVPVDQPGLLRSDYIPGDIGFDPLGLKPTDEEEFRIMQTKELQNGRLAMLAATGFMAQELTDGMGIIQHFTASS